MFSSFYRRSIVPILSLEHSFDSSSNSHWLSNGSMFPLVICALRIYNIIGNHIIGMYLFGIVPFLDPSSIFPSPSIRGSFLFSNICVIAMLGLHEWCESHEPEDIVIFSAILCFSWASHSTFMLCILFCSFLGVFNVHFFHFLCFLIFLLSLFWTAPFCLFPCHDSSGKNIGMLFY